jgi:hypothetical protein
MPCGASFFRRAAISLSLLAGMKAPAGGLWRVGGSSNSFATLAVQAPKEHDEPDCPEKYCAWRPSEEISSLDFDADLTQSSRFDNNNCSVMRKLYKRLSTTATIALLMAASLATAGEAANANDERPDILKALDGNWVMSGDVMGRPATYDMVAAPALQGAFTEMHMKDVQGPAKYEAAVFLGYAPDSQTVIVHWMDRFGAKASIPHATGHIAGNTVQFTFPYKSGQLRDTFTYSPETSSWNFALESAQPDGSWKHFARYTVKRK